MELTVGSRLKHAWNAFLNRAPTANYQYGIGGGYAYRPDRFRLTRGNERSIVTSVYNRIALDVAAINIQHVQLDDEGRFLNVIKSGLNDCLSLEANLDQTGRAFISAAIKVLASACKDFGSMQWSEIGKGLTSIGILLAEIATFTNLTGNAKHVISTGIALIAIAGAMKIMASAVEDFGSMQWDEIGRGLTVMAGALAEITLAVNLMPKNMVSTGVGLIAVAGALTILSNVLSTMGNFTWEEIGKGLVTMGGALAELSIALNLMNGTLAGSAALLIASASLAVLAPVLSILGAMSWEAIAKGFCSIYHHNFL